MTVDLLERKNGREFADRNSLRESILFNVHRNLFCVSPKSPHFLALASSPFSLVLPRKFSQPSVPRRHSHLSPSLSRFSVRRPQATTEMFQRFKDTRVSVDTTRLTHERDCITKTLYTYVCAISCEKIFHGTIRPGRVDLWEDNALPSR